MNPFASILIRIFIYLIALAVGTFVMLFLLEIIAIPIPPLQTYLSCPAGSTIEYSMQKQPYDRPGETTLVRACLDSSGKNQTAFSDELYNQRQFNLFLPLGFASMLIIEIIWIAVRFLIRLNRRRQNHAD